MTSLSTILAIAVVLMLIENICLVKLSGVSSFFGEIKKPATALLLGGTVAITVILSSLITWLLHYFLLAPLKFDYLYAVALVLITAAFVFIIRALLKKSTPSLYKNFGVSFPVVSANCAVLGAVIILVVKNYSLLFSVLNGLFGAIGFTVVMFTFACMRERIEHCNVENKLKGLPIAIITAIIMLLAFAGFYGIKF